MDSFEGGEIPVDPEHFLFALGAGKGIISIGIYDLTGEIKNTFSSRINKFLHHKSKTRKL